MISVVILGTGNLAQHLCGAFSKAKSVKIIQVFGRNQDQLQWFLDHSAICTDPKKIATADIYLIAVSDASILEVSQHLLSKNGLVAHTSGATPMRILPMESRGVFYPLQTFTKGKSVDFESIPICIEGQTDRELRSLKELATSISSEIHDVDSEQRKELHLAAVFANNFTNHLYRISEDICKRNHLSFELMKPLIEETAQKIKFSSPADAQTGPARRGDQKSIDQHLSLLTNDREKEIYSLLSDAIKSEYEKKL